MVLAYQDTIVVFRDLSPTVVKYDTGALVLVGLLLGLLALLFVLMLAWAGRQEHTSFLGDTITSAVLTVQRQRLMEPVVERWQAGEFHRQALADATWFDANRPPSPHNNLKNESEVQFALDSLRRRGRIGTLPPGLGGVSEHGDQIREYIIELRSWERDMLEPQAQQLRRAEEARNDEAAKVSTKRALGSLDFATIRGRGPQFVLQFTAVVVIIFATLALGVLGRLSSEQAGTILAAIAGYVLGQSTGAQGRAKGSEAAPRTAPPKDASGGNVPRGEAGAPV